MVFSVIVNRYENHDEILSSTPAYFVQEADTLEVIEKNVELPEASNKSRKHDKILILVHDGEDLSRLFELSKSSTNDDDPSRAWEFKKDVKMTKKLHDEANQVIDNITPSRKSRDRSTQTTYSKIQGYPCYRNLKGVYDTIDALVAAAQTIPNLSVTKTDIGDTYLKVQNPNFGYDLFVLKITGDGVTNNGRSTQKGILFAMFGIHAREYAPPELGTCWAETLVYRYGIDADITSILDHTEIHLLLQSNPDGRYVAETQPALYKRKNMNDSVGSCSDSNLGVDLNRNFRFKFGLASGSSGDPCSQTYRGNSTVPEPEVSAVMNYINGLFPVAQRKADPEGVDINLHYGENAMGFFLIFTVTVISTFGLGRGKIKRHPMTKHCRHCEESFDSTTIMRYLAQSSRTSFTKYLEDLMIMLTELWVHRRSL